MDIRTVTLFDEFVCPPPADRLEILGGIGRTLKAALEAEGYPVQTIRLALGSAVQTAGGDPARLPAAARELEAGCAAAGIDYATVGIACPLDPGDFVDAIPEALAATTRIFAACMITDDTASIRTATARRAAETIRRCSTITPDGFGNLRFAALANVPPGVPFLPGAYHGGGPASLAIGVEAASLAVEACRAASTLDECRERLIALIESHAESIAKVVDRVRPAYLRFRGIDFSLAPFPDLSRSVGTAIERVSGVRVGEPGTLAATAFLTDTLRRARIPRAGYSGVFLPVFEDAVLAARATERLYSINDLLLWSAVCGTGLDTVPLPGDVSAATLAAILVDLAALALRLDKPLTARLMPIPGKKAGDRVEFDFPYFAPTRVLEARGPGLGGLLAGADIIPQGARA